MDTKNYRDIAKNVRSQLPFYLQQGDYENFVKFLELYYEWMAQDKNPIGVGSELLDYNDIDETLDIFVDEFKGMLADSFPNNVKIKSKNQLNAELSELFGASAVEGETFETDDFIGNGISSAFPMTYREPSYYIDRDVDVRVLEIKVYANPTTGVYTPENDIPNRTTETPEQIFESLTFPDDYVELTLDEDYIIQDDRIVFYDPTTNQIKAPTDQVAIRILYRLRNSNETANTGTTKTKKTQFKNKKQFLKFMKEFYLSKGSQKSYEFLFRTFFNEDIEFYYPKENVFKVSNNEWITDKSIRTIPSNKKIDRQPVRVIGQSSNAMATIERMDEFELDGNPVREYFIASIFGEFQDREKVFIEMDNGVQILEELYTCVTGVKIINQGRNYPRNMYLNSFISDPGSGVGFSARISDTTRGEVDKVEVYAAGDGYITGEYVDFDGTGTLGDGAMGRITKVDGTTEDKTVTFVQDPVNESYPTMYWNIGDTGEEYSSAFSRNANVVIVNKDYLWDDTKLLYDFETLKTIREFKELKNDLPSTRTNIRFEIPENIGSKWGDSSIRVNEGFIRVPDIADLIKDDNEITIDTWYLPQTVEVTNGYGAAIFAFNNADGSGNNLILWHTIDDEFTLMNSQDVFTSGTLPIDYNGWNHIAVHASKSNGSKVYLNGVLVLDTPNIGTQYIDADNVLLIGADSDAFGADDNPPPTRQEIFDSWTRFSHNSSGTYPANSAETTSFSYNSSNDTISCTANTSTMVGFVSPPSEQYQNYELGVNVSSNSSDDDMIGVVIGFEVDDNGKEHSLSVIRGQGGISGGAGYRIIYNYLQSDEEIVFDGNSVAPAQSGGWTGLYSRIKVIRDQNEFTVTVSQLNTTVPTDDDLDPTTTFTFNLSDYSWGDLFAGSSRYGYTCHSQDNSTWSGIVFEVLGDPAYGDYVDAFYDTFRITTGKRFDTFVDAANGNAETLLKWDLDPVEKLNVAAPAENTKNSNADYFWAVLNNRLVIMQEVFDTGGKALTWDELEGLLSTFTGDMDNLTVAPDAYNRILKPIVVPDWWTVEIQYTNLPRGGVKRVDLVTGGFGYMVPPTTRVAEETGSYISTGTGAVLRSVGDNIGGLKRINITQAEVTNRYHGFGVGYITPPTIDLTGLGDGTAVVEVETGPVCVRDGTFLTNQGFLSDNNRLHDSYLWQDYSYVIKVGRVIDEWRDIVKKIVHPAGLMMFGELTLTTLVEGKRLKDAVLYLLYEIIKNADVSVKNMDGLGTWTARDTEEKIVDEGNDARTSIGTWSNDDTFFMEQFGDLGPVHAHGPFTSENIDLTVQLPEHSQVKYQVAWHHVDSHDNEINKLQYKNKFGEFVDLAIWTKSLALPNPTTLETFGDTTYTWFNNKTYSYAPWAGNPDDYENHGFAIIDTGWITHDSDELVIRHVVGTDQDITDEASYLSHVKVFVRSTEAQNSNDIMSHGYAITYDNRQESYNDLIGVSDDTPIGQSFDTGAGRYALLDKDMNNANFWEDVRFVGLNWKDVKGTDYSRLYEDEIIERNFTVYNISDKPITDDEWKTTQPWARFKVISAVSDTVDGTVLFGVDMINNYSELPNYSPLNKVEFRWDKKSRGNVERVNTQWIGAVKDGANPRDEKFIVRIIPRDMPDSGTTYKSLERFKFFFSSIFPFEELVRYRFSPYSEAETSPLLDYYGFNGPFNNISMKGTTYTIVQNPDGTNSFGMVPTYGNDSYLGVTDGSDHEWPQETIENVMKNYDKSYRAVLDASVNLWPKLLVITEEDPTNDGPRISGMTWESVERMKFNQTPQSVDNYLYAESTEEVERRYLDRTNITHETIISQYSSEPTTFEELKQLQQI